jgi:hypothetical protein
MIALHLRFVKQDRQKSTGTSRRRFYKKSQTLLETCKKMIILTTPQQRTSASSALRRFFLIIMRILRKLTPVQFGLFHSNCKSRSTAVFFTRVATSTFHTESIGNRHWGALRSTNPGGRQGPGVPSRRSADAPALPGAHWYNQLVVTFQEWKQ